MTPPALNAERVTAAELVAMQGSVSALLAHRAERGELPPAEKREAVQLSERMRALAQRLPADERDAWTAVADGLKEAAGSA